MRGVNLLSNRACFSGWQSFSELQNLFVSITREKLYDLDTNSGVGV